MPSLGFRCLLQLLLNQPANLLLVAVVDDALGTDSDVHLAILNYHVIVDFLILGHLGHLVELGPGEDEAAHQFGPGFADQEGVTEERILVAGDELHPADTDGREEVSWFLTLDREEMDGINLLAGKAVWP